MELKYKSCGNDTYNACWSDCKFYPIVFCFDYGENINPHWPCTHSRSCFNGRCDRGDGNCGLYYHIFRENSDQSISQSGYYWRYFLEYDIDQYYPTFPDIYRPQFCVHGYGGGDKGELAFVYVGQAPRVYY